MSDLFNGDGTDPVIDPNKNYLEDLVGEGKKFKSVDDLARGKAEADLYIEKLRKSLADHEQELNARKRIEDIVATLAPPSTPANEPNNRDNHDEGTGRMAPDALTPEMLEQLLEKKLYERENKSRADENFRAVTETLEHTLGPSYPQELAKRAAETGLSKEELNALARKSPKAFYQLMGINPQKREPDVFVPPRSSVNPTGQNQAHNQRNKAFYDDLKRRDPAAWRSDKVQNQMHQDAIRLKEAFFV